MDEITRIKSDGSEIIACIFPRELLPYTQAIFDNVKQYGYKELLWSTQIEADASAGAKMRAMSMLFFETSMSGVQYFTSALSFIGDKFLMQNDDGSAELAKWFHEISQANLESAMSQIMGSPIEPGVMVMEFDTEEDYEAYRLDSD